MKEEETWASIAWALFFALAIVFYSDALAAAIAMEFRMATRAFWVAGVSVVIGAVCLWWDTNKRKGER